MSNCVYSLESIMIGSYAIIYFKCHLLILKFLLELKFVETYLFGDKFRRIGTSSFANSPGVLENWDFISGNQFSLRVA